MNPQARNFITNNLNIDYDAILFEKGLEWLNNFWMGNHKAAQTMSYSKIFWNWWSTQWNVRSMQCIYGLGFDYHETKITPQEKVALIEAYVEAHNLQNTTRIYPSNTIRDLMLQIKHELKPIT